MGTIIWLLIATGCGYFIGEHWFDAAMPGAFIGLLAGLLIRFAPGSAGDVIADALDVGGGLG